VIQDSGFGRPDGRQFDDSDVESQIAAGQQTDGLQSKDDALRKEKSIPRAQVEQAVVITQGIEELHEKNTKLAAAVRSHQ
jgi:hypothetical protein